MMKSRGYALAVVFVGVLSGTALAESSPDSSLESLKQETRELGEALQEYGADQKEQAEDAINKTLSALDQRIDELEQRVYGLEIALMESKQKI